MRIPRRRALLILAAAFGPLLTSGARPGLGGEGAPAPTVLIVSTEKGGLAAEFAELLGDHDIPATVSLWEQATAERAREFDLVLITAPGRRVDEERVVFDYDRPVLGVGSYGCVYFGLLKLKHGHPHT